MYIETIHQIVKFLCLCRLMLGADFARCEDRGEHADVATNIDHRFRLAPDRCAKVHDSNTAVDQHNIILSIGEISLIFTARCHANIAIMSTYMYSEVVHDTPRYCELKLKQYRIAIKISAGLPRVDFPIKLDLLHCLAFPRHCFR
jgi:hypothetical protein